MLHIGEAKTDNPFLICCVYDEKLAIKELQNHYFRCRSGKVKVPDWADLVKVSFYLMFCCRMLSGGVEVRVVDSHQGGHGSSLFTLLSCSVAKNRCGTTVKEL